MLIQDVDVDVILPHGAEVVAVRVVHGNGVGPAWKAALLSFQFSDAWGGEVEPVAPPTVSERFGPYVYLHTTAATPRPQVITLKVPRDASRLRMSGHRWLSESPVTLAEPLLFVVDPLADLAYEEPLGVDRQPLELVQLSQAVEPGDICELDWEAQAGDGARGALTVRYVGADDRVLLAPVELPIVPGLGAVVPVTAGSGRAKLAVPTGVARVEVAGTVPRGAPVSMVRTSLRRGSSSLRSDRQVVELLSGFPAGVPVLVLVTTEPRSPSGTWALSRTEPLVREAVSAGWCVVVSRLTTEVAHADRKAPTVVEIDVRHLERVVEHLITDTDRHHALLVSSLPSFAVVGLVDRCRDHGWRVVYEAREHLEELHRRGRAPWYDSNLELRLVRRSDRLVAVSPALRDGLGVVSGQSEVALIPNTAPPELVGTEKPWRPRRRTDSPAVVGCLSGSTGAFFDWAALDRAAGMVEGTAVEVAGVGPPPDLRVTNLRHLGDLSWDECLAAARRWRAGVLPLPADRLGRSLDPPELSAYTALGLRVVAPSYALGGVAGAFTYTGVDEMAPAIIAAVADSRTPGAAAPVERPRSAASLMLQLLGDP